MSTEYFISDLELIFIKPLVTISYHLLRKKKKLKLLNSIIFVALVTENNSITSFQ